MRLAFHNLLVKLLLSEQRAYALTIMVISVIAYGYMLGSIAAGLTNTATLYSAFKEKISAVKLFLKVSSSFEIYVFFNFHT